MSGAFPSLEATFTTSPPRHLTDEDRRFIWRKAEEGFSALAIAHMVRKPVTDVDAAMPRGRALRSLPRLSAALPMTPPSALAGLPPAVRQIVADVARRHGVSAADLRGQSRKREVAWPRQEAMWRIAQLDRFSLPQIGKFFDGRDHTTVIHACRAHEARNPPPTARLAEIHGDRDGLRFGAAEWQDGVRLDFFYDRLNGTARLFAWEDGERGEVTRQEAKRLPALYAALEAHFAAQQQERAA